MTQRRRGPALNHSTTGPARRFYFPEVEGKITVMHPAGKAVREFPQGRV